MGFDINGSILSTSMLTPEGAVSARKFRKVTPNMIDSVGYSGTYSVNASGADSNGFYYLDFAHGNGGCDSSGFAIKIKSAYDWSYLACKFYCEGVASCWNFNADGYSPSSGMLSWDSSQGDRIYDYLNCFEYSQFAKKSSACDNNSDNFMHSSFAVSSTRSFYMLSRRNGTSSAGPTHGRACNYLGRTVVTEIYIY
jgi:hypothetical protein